MANPFAVVRGAEPGSGRSAIPIYFSDQDQTLFGWLHKAVGPRADVGLLVCKPFGYEALSSHRSTKAFAESAAAMGYPALRFDYLGTGDSGDILPDANQLEVWTSNVAAAVAELRRVTGVRHVCLLGVRLGGLLAMRAAQKFDGAASMILIAPVFDGPRYLRELRVTKLAMEKVRVDRQSSGRAADLEVNGFTLSSASVASLSKISISAGSWPSDLRTLVIDGASLPTSQDWVNEASEGAHVKYIALPGLVGMIMRPPLRAEVPRLIVAAVSDWLATVGQLDNPVSAALEVRVETTETIRIPVSIGCTQDIIERPSFISSHPDLFGIVSSPALGHPSQCVLLLNSGADSHIGANRMHVQFARAWAAADIVVLRLDLEGIGDSATRPGSDDDDVFPMFASQDVIAAVNYMRDQYGVSKVTVAGVCSGAYHALQAVVAGLNADQVFMINPQIYFWGPGKQMSDWQLAEVVRKSSIYINQAILYWSWQWLFRYKMRFVRLARSFLSGILLGLQYVARKIAFLIGAPPSHDLTSQVLIATRSGARVIIVFAEGEPDIPLLQLTGTSSTTLGEKCRVHVIKGGDHTFSRRSSRALVIEVLTKYLLH